MNAKRFVVNIIKSNKLGKELIFQIKKVAGLLPQPDMQFPELINIETASACNLSCIHCPPHMKEFRNKVRKFGIMKIELFDKLMDEIDNHGVRRIALHKDGEPLLHPKIIYILERVKKYNNHIVYLTTNAHRLTKEISKSILENKIDIINFSIGAATEEFYEKVRGKNFKGVIDNILTFLELRNKSSFKPRVIVQIINLKQFPEMKNELKLFRNFWGNYDVEIQEWENLTWGVFDYKKAGEKRYPCYALWESIVVNSDGIVSACCMDWLQKLQTGDANAQSLESVWKGEPLRKIRKMHIENRTDELPLCPTCNYWAWRPRLGKYPL